MRSIFRIVALFFQLYMIPDACFIKLKVDANNIKTESATASCCQDNAVRQIYDTDM